MAISNEAVSGLPLWPSPGRDLTVALLFFSPPIVSALSTDTPKKVHSGTGGESPSTAGKLDWTFAQNEVLHLLAQHTEEQKENDGQCGGRDGLAVNSNGIDEGLLAQQSDVTAAATVAAEGAGGAGGAGGVRAAAAAVGEAAVENESSPAAHVFDSVEIQVGARESARTAMSPAAVDSFDLGACRPRSFASSPGAASSTLSESSSIVATSESTTEAAIHRSSRSNLQKNERGESNEEGKREPSTGEQVPVRVCAEVSSSTDDRPVDYPAEAEVLRGEARVDGDATDTLDEGGAGQKLESKEPGRIAVDTAVYGELLRARDAWRDAEGQLARSQAESDELRTVLRSVS